MNAMVALYTSILKVSRFWGDADWSIPVVSKLTSRKHDGDAKKRLDRQQGSAKADDIMYKPVRGG